MDGVAHDLTGLENFAFGKPAAQSSLSPWSRPHDARGAVNGRRTGGFGFHTDAEPSPWWQVDLQAPLPITCILLWNREDSGQEQARNLAIEFSDDGEIWDTAFRTGDVVFGGARTGTPLAIACGGRTARFVRIRKLDPGPLHLDEVEVYGPERLARRLFRDFCLAIGEVGAAQGGPHKDLASIRFGTPQTRPDEVRSISLMAFGRFGNNVTQLLNAIHFARCHGIGRIHLGDVNPAGLKQEVRIGGIAFRLDEADGSDGADLQARMYFRGQFPRSYAGLDANALAEIAGAYLRPLFEHRFIAGPAPGEPAIHVHLRAGDVFGRKSVPALYGQPPLAFYSLAIAHARREFGVRRVVLVHEDEANPCIPALRDWLGRAGLPFSVQSGTLEQDVGALMSAEHLVVSKGTFAFPIFLLSSRLRTVYGFRDDAVLGMEKVPYGDLLRHRGIRGLRVADAAGRYIPPDGWRNSPEQRQLMLDYAEADLRLEG